MSDNFEQINIKPPAELTLVARGFSTEARKKYFKGRVKQLVYNIRMGKNGRSSK